ncbi:MAG: hypothetical protein D6719_06865 [Candidatus Dadabacteria bacterium]|nr:MAG: hypothetical protein D6719_06865 [Candidatus Dadabacteria bacterium]
MPEEDKDQETPQEGEGQAKKSKKTMIIVIVVVVLILAAGIPLAYFALSKGSSEDGEADKDAAKHAPEVLVEGYDDEDEYDENEEPLGAIFPMETLVVNLSGGRYIRCQIQLEFEKRTIPKRFYSRLVPIKDALIKLLTTRTEKDVLTAKGKETLKEDIKDVVNEILKKQEVKRVYFTQFVVR